jgi:signal transduction histidine kinase
MLRLLWRVSPLRGLIESWLAAGIFLAALVPAMSGAPGLVISMFFLLAAILCAAVSGFRTRLAQPGGAFWPGARYEMLAGAGLALGLLAFTSGLLAAIGKLNLPGAGHAGLAGSLFFLALSGPGYLAARGASWIWKRWCGMREAHFVWALTHAQLVVVAALGGVGLLSGVIYTSNYDPRMLAGLSAGSIFSRVVVWIFTLTLMAIAAATAGVLIFLPPSALFSYWIARRMTRRLEHLTHATTALQRGHLSGRVAVEGKDEVATLQSNFNAMAADLERSTRALQAERDKVTALLTAQRELTASVSHELRTPISTLTGYLEYVDQHLEDRPLEATRQDLKVAGREAERLKSILNDLLLLSQAEVNQLSLNMEAVCVETVAQRAADSVTRLAWESKRIKVALDVEAGLPPVWADALRLEQVLLNLLHNALRHTGPGGLVSLMLSRTGEHVQIEVADSGDGIAAEDLPHIWDRFYRAKSAGAGLGLALVKELVEAMRGSVCVESIPGSGSSFRVVLPVSAA